MGSRRLKIDTQVPAYMLLREGVYISNVNEMSISSLSNSNLPLFHKECVYLK